MTKKEHDKKRYWEIKADPVKHAAYLEQKRRNRLARQTDRGYETERKRKWRAANKDRNDAIRKASHAVETALRNGRLVRPETCSQCGKAGEIEAHHHLGYEPEHRLDIVWLCQTCHSGAHHPKQQGMNTRRER